MKKIYSLLAATLFMLPFIANAQFGVTSASLSKTNVTPCDTILVTINGGMGCTNTVINGVTYSRNSTAITLTVGFTDPQICLGAITPFSANYSLSLANLSSGTYTINYSYGSTVSTVSSTVTVVSLSTADAGNDTSLCETSSFMLGGNTPGTGATASWSVKTGSATLNSMTNPGATASNLDYGLNEFEWTMTDSTCTTVDVVKVWNYESPSAAIVEAAKFSCYDTISINATPASVGNGQWYSGQSGTIVINNKMPNAKAIGLNKGFNKFGWTVTNGVCPASTDTLTIEHETVTDTPTVSSSGANLTSTAAPGYQWYINSTIIPGATSQNYKALQNGLYKVMAVYPDCDNGIFSNEINMNFVGIEEQSENRISFFPNPTSSVITIAGISSRTNVQLYDFTMRLLHHEVITNNASLDLSTMAPGTYLLRITNDEIDLIEKLIIQ